MEAEDRHLEIGDDEGDCDPPFKSDNSQTGAYVVAALTAFACDREAAAVGFEAGDIAEGRGGACVFGDPVAQFDQVASRFLCEDDTPAPQRLFLPRAEYRARASANTDRAAILRDGPAATAS